MRRIIFGLLGILGTLLGAALILPFFLNINDYKPQLIAKAKEALGREVYIKGKLSLSLLPSPELSIEHVGISNLVGGSPQDLVHIKTLTVSVDLLPLLKKQVKIKTVELHYPEVLLEKLADGRVNWALTLSTPSAQTTPSSPSSSAPGFDVALDKVLVHHGRLVYRDKGKDIEVQEINASSKSDTLQGPYAILGTFKAFGQNIKLDTKLGTFGESQDVTLKAQVGEASTLLEGKASLSSLTFTGTLKASVDPAMFMASGSKGKEFPLLSGPLHVTANVSADATAISLNQTKFEIGSARPTGDVKVALKEALQVEGNLKNLPGQGQCAFTLSPSSQGLTGSVHATVAHAKEFLNWLNIETKTMPENVLGSLTLSTDYTFGDVIRLKNLTLMVRDAKLQGDVSWQSQKGHPLIVIDLESPKLESVLKVMGVKDPKPLGIGKLKAHAQWSPTSFHLDHLKGQLGKHLSFAGQVTVDHATIKPKVKAVLSLNAINIDTLLASRQTAGSSYPEDHILLISTNHPPTRSPWSHAPVDFSFLDKFDGDFEISASQLRQKDIVVSQPKLAATVQNGRLDIKALTGSVFDGSFVGNGYLTASNALRFHMALKGANLKYLSPQGASIKIVGGKLFLSADLSAHGRSLYAMVQNLNGPVNITAKDGVVNGFDLPTLSRRLGNLRDPASLLGLLNTSMGKGQTPFSSFKGDLLFKDGVGTIQSMNLMAQGGEGQASGQIDLPRYLLDIHAEFRLTEHPRIPPFHMRLSGSIDNPSRKLDTGALQKYMMENVFKGVIDKLGKGQFKPADLLGSILGGSKGDDKAAAQEGQPQQQPDKGRPLDKPEQIVKDIFKGIF
ncbi:MAG: hypothetical protein K0R76_1435 [Alphaproteobacteria bacterium]|jgi:uncharacterized protein involved in outer membrane biogenesis|nr:hypothetical protein [Alphaproteobacteria bacterium]